MLLCPPLIGGGIKQCFCLTSVCLTSVAYIRHNSRTERPRKNKIGIEVAHITRDSATTFKVKGQGHQTALVGCTGRSTWTYSNGHLSICVHDIYHVTTCWPGAPCGLRGCKNGPAPFPGKMSYKATKPGLVYHILECCIIVLWFIMAPFYVLLVFVTVCSPT